MIKVIANFYRKKAIQKRKRFFLNYLDPSVNDKILDLGSDDGSHLASILPFRENVHIADISKESLNRGEKIYGFKSILLDENANLPFSDNEFDIVFCSSVLEHVTVNKNQMYEFKTNKEFNAKSYERQKLFASEIRRVGKRYFVQTPNRYFIIESHTWLPVIIVFFPRETLLTIIKFFNKFWPKKTSPDWHLLTKTGMQELFPDAEILVEKSFWMPKSFMAIKR